MNACLSIHYLLSLIHIYPLCQGIAKFGEVLEEKSDGRFKLELFYSGSLGDKATTVQGRQTGTIDAAMLMLSLIHILTQGMDRKEAMKKVAKDRGISKRDVYQGLMERDE